MPSIFFHGRFVGKIWATSGEFMAKTQRWVVKAGSNMVCSGGPILVRSWMQQLVMLRKKHGIEVIWVTSGAIASARERTDFQKKNRTLSEKQALSAIGQPMVMELYNMALQSVGLLGSQVLLTYDDLSNSSRKKNLANTLEKLLEWKVVPILNENDAVSTDEIKFGDNDSLSAKVASHLKADRLIILTDVEGFYDSDPRLNRQAQLIETLSGVNAKLLSISGLKGGSAAGTGGMYSKLLAAQMATRKGIETWLVKGDLNGVLNRVAANEVLGTRILAGSKR